MEEANSKEESTKHVIGKTKQRATNVNGTKIIFLITYEILLVKFIDYYFL